MVPTRTVAELHLQSPTSFCSLRRRATAQSGAVQEHRAFAADGSQCRHPPSTGHPRRRRHRLTVSAAALDDRTGRSLGVKDTAQQADTSSHREKLAAPSSSSSSSEGVSPSPPPEDEEPPPEGEVGSILKWLAPLAALGGLALMAGGGFLFKDQIKVLLGVFIEAVEGWGPLGYLAFGGVYTLLELAIIPAIPLTMTAGVLFGVLPGLAVVSASGTLAATLSFLIARYAARDKVLELAKGNKKFAAIDRAIGRDSFKVVLLLRLSPLLPLAASNYLYGLTSVALLPYVLGSWLGMLPGTLAYVSAGSYGRALLDSGEAGGIGVETWQVALGAAVTLLALGYVGRVAKKALDEADEDFDA